VDDVTRNPLTLSETPILDYGSEVVARFTDSIQPIDNSDVGFLRAAHAAVAQLIRPIYTVRERQPASQTILLRRGSCSQRIACLEALARRNGISTRVRALCVSGRFWNRRFPLMRTFIPNRILLAWPQFGIDTEWLGVEEIFGPLEQRATVAARFANDGETLFEAVQSAVVDFEGKTKVCSTACDLSGFVVGNAGVFATRDDLFAQLGSFEDTWRGRAFEWLYGGRSSA
jgi:hypothetical protein